MAPGSDKSSTVYDFIIVMDGRHVAMQLAESKNLKICIIGFVPYPTQLRFALESKCLELGLDITHGGALDLPNVTHRTDCIVEDIIFEESRKCQGVRTSAKEKIYCRNGVVMCARSAHLMSCVMPPPMIRETKGLMIDIKFQRDLDLELPAVPQKKREITRAGFGVRSRMESELYTTEVDKILPLVPRRRPLANTYIPLTPNTVDLTAEMPPNIEFLYEETTTFLLITVQLMRFDCSPVSEAEYKAIVSACEIAQDVVYPYATRPDTDWADYVKKFVYFEESTIKTDPLGVNPAMNGVRCGDGSVAEELIATDLRAQLGMQKKRRNLLSFFTKRRGDRRLGFRRDKMMSQFAADTAAKLK
jgi:hypothetical protein